MVEAREKLPSGVGEKQKWIHARVTLGTLEGPKPQPSRLFSAPASQTSLTYVRKRLFRVSDPLTPPF